MFKLSQRRFNNAKLPLFDTHCHIGLKTIRGATSGAFPQFQRAIQQNVKGFCIVGIDYKSSQLAQSVARDLHSKYYSNNNNNKNENEKSENEVKILYSAGIHPHHAMKHETEFPLMKKFILETLENENKISDGKNNSAKLAAIGETGMDFFKSKTSKEDQKASFIKHIELCVELNLPIIIHARDCYDEIFDIIEEVYPRYENINKNNNTTENNNKLKRRGVIHCFSSDRKRMERAVDLNFYVSFPCPLGYNRSYNLKEAATHCPLEHIVIETDSPFLPPQFMRGQTNEPQYVNHVLDCLVDCKMRNNSFSLGKSRQEIFELVTKQLWSNSLDLFNL